MLVETQTNKKIKIIRSDNGREFCNAEFNNYLKKMGIVHQTTCPYTPEQNGLCERINRTLVEKARCMLFDANCEARLSGLKLQTQRYICTIAQVRLYCKENHLMNYRIVSSQI